MRTGALGGTLAVACALALAGCDYLPFGYTSVKEITAAPARFEGEVVKIKGHAEGATSVMGFRAFLLRDDTGEIVVVTTGELPASGESVALKGTVRSAVIIGGSSVGLRVEETKRLR
jgi:hypothetical protein